MITVNDLKAAGYKKFPSSNYKPGSTCGWQKCIYNHNGQRKLYFINLIQYDFDNRQSFELDVMMYKKNPLERDRYYSFELNYIPEPMDTVEYVERFYYYTFIALNCVPDIHNNP